MKMMKMDEKVAFQSSEEEEDDDEDVMDSDEELQAAFARGDLQPGLVVMEKSGEKSSKEKAPVINNVPLLGFKLEEIKLPKKFGWVERLDIVNGTAPLAPELALQLDDHKTRREREIKHVNAQRAKKKKSGSGSQAGQPLLKKVEEDPVHNDFLRETNFYRQAQEAILKCLPRLKELGVPTARPQDYFAEMAKSDTHMQKVAKVLHKKQVATEKSETVRKIRAQRKIAKQTQVHVLQERQKAKTEFMENVKKYRKGQKNNLDFLDDRKGRGGSQTGGKGGKPLVNRRRQNKDEKYGYGGKKKGSKWNTRESLDNFDNGKKKGGTGRGGVPQKGRGGFQQKGKGGFQQKGKAGMSGRSNFGKKKGASGPQRPGKASRQKMKARKT